MSKPHCVLIIGGTISFDRDGNLFRPEAPPRDALARLAAALSAGGYASLRYDQVGRARSRAKRGFRGTYTSQARVAAGLIRWIRDSGRFGKIIILGESAGAFVACLAARAGTEFDAAVLLAPFCGSPEDLFEYNYARLARYVESSPERTEWAGGRFRFEMAMGRHYREMFAAAREGRDTFELRDNGFVARIDVSRRREELDYPPERMFRSISTPALVLAGEHDLNVPPEHGLRAAGIMRDAGNDKVAVHVIPRADHSFQIPPEDEDARFRERYTFDSFRRPYHPRLYTEVLKWLRRRAPTGFEADTEEIDAIASRPTAGLERAPGVRVSTAV